HYLSVHHVVQKHVRGAAVDGNVRLAREIVPVRVDVIRLVIGVRLVQANAVQVHLLVDDANAVAGHADATLDESLTDIDGIAEHDDVAAFYVGIRQKILAHGAVWSERQLIHQQVVADQKRVFHGTRRNYIRLYQRCGQKQQQEDGDGPLSDGAARALVLRVVSGSGNGCGPIGYRQAVQRWFGYRYDVRRDLGNGTRAQG